MTPAAVDGGRENWLGYAVRLTWGRKKNDDML